MAIKFLDDEPVVEKKKSGSGVKFLDNVIPGSQQSNSRQKVLDDINKGVPPTIAALADVGRTVISQNTIEELIGQGHGPYGAAAIRTGQQVLGPVINYGNSLLGGIPEKAIQALGEERQQTDDLGVLGRIGARAANVAGDISGFTRGPLRAAGAVAGKIPSLSGFAGSDIATSAIRGAAQFGGASAISTPEQEEIDNVKARMFRTGAGAVAGAIFGAASGGIDKFKKTINKEADIARDIRATIKGKHAEKSANYENSLYQQTLKSDLKKVDVKEFRNKYNLNFNNTVDELSRKVPQLKEITKNPDNVSLQQLQNAINGVKSKLSKTKLSGKGLRSSDKEVTTVIDKLQQFKYEKFPEMKQVDAAYASAAENLKVFDNLKIGNTMSSMRNALKDAEKTETLKALIPSDMFNEIKNLTLMRGLGSTTVSTIKEFIRYGIVYQMLRNAIGNKITSFDNVSN